MVTYASIMAGQMVVASADIGNGSLFMMAGILFCASLIPTAISSAMAPKPLQSVSLDIKGLYRNSPVASAACLLVGIANGAWGTLGAVYGARIGISTFEIALMMSLVVLAGALAQMPVGRLSDRMDRRYVLAGAAAGCGVIALLIFVAMPRSGGAVLVMTAAYGMLAYTLYSIAVAHANDHASPEDFVKALEKYPHLNPETRESVKELLAATSPELREYVFVETLSDPSPLDRVVKESAGEVNVYVDGFLIDESNQYYKTELSRTSGEGSALRQEAAFTKPGFPPNYNTKIDENYGKIIEEKAAKYGVDPAKIKAVIMAESSGNPLAQEKIGSTGLMQILPSTARGLDPSNAVLSDAQISEKLKNPEYNIELGTKHLAELLQKHKDPALAHAIYNGGPMAGVPSRDCPGLKAWQCEWDDKAHKTANTGYAGTRKYVQKIDDLEKALRTGQ